jgi:hypothetical protein
MKGERRLWTVELNGFSETNFAQRETLTILASSARVAIQKAETYARRRASMRDTEVVRVCEAGRIDA